MPLVVFRYKHAFEERQVSPPVIDKFVMKAKLPFRARKASWRLVDVSAISWDAGDDPHPIRWIEIKFPDLMREDRTFYSLTSVGGNPQPTKSLRFYMNKWQTDSNAARTPITRFLGVDASPNYNLGFHMLDNEEISMEITAVNGIFPDLKASLSQFEIILEYE